MELHVNKNIVCTIRIKKSSPGSPKIRPNSAGLLVYNNLKAAEIVKLFYAQRSLSHAKVIRPRGDKMFD